jgi:hypothetical protein
MTGNVYQDHPLMTDSGTFWRCDHGNTGYDRDMKFFGCPECAQVDPGEKFKAAARDVLNAFDDGVKHCTGIMSDGELVWKGSFITFMELLRASLPPETP